MARNATVALIPARGGSKRVPGKNVRALAERPLIAYTVSAALDSGQFDKVLVSSDDPATLEIAHSYGADALRRPDRFATGASPDIEWVSHALAVLGGSAAYSAFSILRPTSPFRTPATIQRAFAEWRAAHNRGDRYSSLRAVEPCGQRPEKMWRIHGRELVPLLPGPPSPAGRELEGGSFLRTVKPDSCVTPSPRVIPAAASVIPTASFVIPTEAEGSGLFPLCALAEAFADLGSARGGESIASDWSDPSAAVGMTKETAEMTQATAHSQPPALFALAGALRPGSGQESWREGEGRPAGSAMPAAPQPQRPQPWHDSQHTTLPLIYVQNASLEIAWTHTVEESGTISGLRILPFLTEGHEGLDVNTELDWAMAELLIARGEAALPVIRRASHRAS